MREPMKGKRNGYDCPACGHLLVTVHADDGVAPMFKKCTKCDGMASSRMYDGSVDHLEPELEWYRPRDLSVLGDVERQYVEESDERLLFRKPVKAPKEEKG